MTTSYDERDWKVLTTNRYRMLGPDAYHRIGYGGGDGVEDLFQLLFRLIMRACKQLETME